MTDLQTQPGELGARQKARREIATLHEQGFYSPPETLLLSAIYDLHERLARLERLAAQPQGRGKRNAAATDPESSC